MDKKEGNVIRKTTVAIESECGLLVFYEFSFPENANISKLQIMLLRGVSFA